jgi:RNA polymerase sigma factor (sigma-70 family)
MPKALKLVPPPEEQFVERYERLHAWALAVTSGNEDKADDLVHDAFIQFTLRRAELGAIQNTDGYLKRMLRNMFVSQLRRSSNLQQMPQSAADYDSADLGLRTIDPQAQVQIANELHRICQYATERKETSKAGSVLILRFFHGYYLNEIGQVLRSPMDSIYTFLKIARHEAKLYLDDPNTMKFVVDPSPAKPLMTHQPQSPSKLLTELRSDIFRSRRGACLSHELLEGLYSSSADQKLDRADAAHIVTCPMCLDEVNEMLDLPLLSERYPTDSLGDNDERDQRGGPTGGGPAGGEGGGDTPASLKRKHGRRFKDVFDHRPHELRIAVNGFVLGSQKIGQELNEQTISVNIDERIGFVEVFSEQGVRLLFCNIDPPVDGDIEQRAEARFSDGRKLEMNIDFRSSWPTLHVLYRDPILASEFETHVEESDRVQSPESKVQSRSLAGAGNSIGVFDPLGIARHWRRGLARKAKNVGRGNWGFGLLLRPASITAVVALAMVAALLLTRLYRGPAPLPSAGALLAQSASGEEAIAASKDEVLHRTISLEERDSSGVVVSRKRIETWQGGGKGIVARRLYNEQGALVAGDFRRSNGVQTIYHHGSKAAVSGQQSAVKDQESEGRKRSEPQIQIRNPQSVLRSSEDVWLLDLSAKDFSSLIGDTANARVDQRGETYVISADASPSSEVKSATLILNRSDLHATAMTLLVESPAPDANQQSAISNRQLRQFHLVESSFDRRPTDAVPASVFEPEPQLLGSDTRGNGDTGNVSASPSLPVPASPVMATPDLQVDVLNLLNQAGADTGEQVSVTKSKGQLYIDGLVDSDNRKRELINALAPIANHPAVRINIMTVAEALETERSKKRKLNQGQLSAQRFDISSGEVPVRDKLRAYFGTDEAANNFAARIIGRSRNAMGRAGAMNRLVNQFTLAEIKTLSPDARAKWLALLRSHARAFEQETAALRQELTPIFGGESAGTSAPEINDDAALVRSVVRLFELGSANDRTVRTALSISSDRAAANLGSDFFRNLRTTEALAQRIQSAK